MPQWTAIRAWLGTSAQRIDSAAPASKPTETNLFAEPSSLAASDIQGLHELIATELAVLLARKTGLGEPTPLLAGARRATSTRWS